MNEFIGQATNSVEPFPERRSTAISDELNQLRKLLEAEIPYASAITFEFDGILKAHIDIRNREELLLVEERLKHVGGGHLLSLIGRGEVPNHPFLHRVTARLQR